MSAANKSFLGATHVMIRHSALFGPVKISVGLTQIHPTDWTPQ
jgi:hypothetical protein